MSFYTKIKTEIKNKKYLIAALHELRKRGEILNYEVNERKETVKVDRDGDIIDIAREKAGYELSGDARVVKTFSDRLKQVYALESIKDNLPLDFEVSSETETAGEIHILLKG